MDAKERIIDNVTKNITGRFANGGDVINAIMDCVEKAGNGNYLEIGVLHGGSLCTIALWKQNLGHTGVCYGVDPFDGYYKAKTGMKNDKKTGVPVSLEIVNSNINKFDLKNVYLIQGKSPDFELSVNVSVVYIDGDHSYEGVMFDWFKVQEYNPKYVIFHDYIANRGVTMACDAIDSQKNKGWKVIKKQEFIFVIEKEI